MNTPSDHLSPSHLMNQAPRQTEYQTPSSVTILWQPIAIFVVEFQANEEGGQKLFRSKVHYFTHDICAVWSDVETDQICHWMAEQVMQEIRSRSIDTIA